MGTISALNLPLARAFAARAWDRAAIVSCASRVIPHFSATFSLVMPMGIKQFCASLDDAIRGLIPPSHFIGFAVIVSTPAPIPIS